MAFSGKATYSAFSDELAVDVGPLITKRAEIITPVLSAIGDAENPNTASSVEHNWMVDEYAPSFTCIVSTAINSASAATALQVDGWAGYVQVGDVFQLLTVDAATSYEHVQVASIVGGGGSASANSIVFNRAVFGTSPTSATAGQSLIFIATASYEGEDRRPGIARSRAQSTNWVQAIQKPVEVSLSMDAVRKYANIGSEFDYQTGLRMDEALRDLENAVIRGTSTGTVGDGSNYRTMKGLRGFITSVHSVAENAFDTDWVDDVIEVGWKLGRYQGCNLGILGSTAQKLFDRLPDVQRQQSQDERGITRVVRTYENGLSGGPIRLVVTPQIDPREFILTHTDDLDVVPLQGRSFRFYEYSLQAQKKTGELAGEYSLEVRNGVSMTRGWISA